MPDVENPKHLQAGNTTAPVAEPVRKLPRARRLLAATIGAATIQFVGGCTTGEMNTVANLMAPPRIGQRMNGQQGSAGLQLVANLMIPPHIPPQAGVSGQLGGAGVSGTAGSSGAAGATPADHADMDAGSDDDAGEA